MLRHLYIWYNGIFWVILVTAPGAPQLIPEECSAENNSVTVAWQPPGGGIGGQRGPTVEGYLLELDDGCGGEFRVSIITISTNMLIVS